MDCILAECPYYGRLKMETPGKQNAEGVFKMIREMAGAGYGSPRFWDMFVGCVAGLCRSSVCWVFEMDGDGVKELGKQGEVGNVEGFQGRAKELTGRLGKKEYVFEPFSLSKV